MNQPVASGSYRGYLERRTVGTKDLKDRLSHYFRRVREGETIRVTDRGKVVAELRAVQNDERDEARVLAELERGGVGASLP